MKHFGFAVLFLLAISFSASTAMAQCQAPTPVRIEVMNANEPPFQPCVGNGEWGMMPNYMDYNGYCWLNGYCTCNAGLSQAYTGVCAHPPCVGSDADSWYSVYLWYYLWYWDNYRAYQAATSFQGCDPYDWTKIKKPALPFERRKPEAIEARLRYDSIAFKYPLFAKENEISFPLNR